MNFALDTEPGTCFICGRRGQTELHHIFNQTAYRRKSTEDGLMVFLCYDCHHNRVHGKDAEAKYYLKRIGQRKWMDTHKGGTQAFVDRYGKNYLEEWEE